MTMELTFRGKHSFDDCSSKSDLIKRCDEIQDWFETLPDDANVLVVHHSPFLELIAYGLFGEVLPQLQPCEGFKIIDEDGILKMQKGIMG